ncbi:MAG: hypothetical protein E7665_08710 [Ruminococcaceae bacterium]|nr:hypothetical protein [Oscillospiraceae bacterium]
MSYCVNCGVELCDSEKSCPLCGVVVNNPKKPYDESVVKPYPNNIEADMHRINMKFGSRLALLILLIPSAITTICDALITKSLSWSLLVTGACFCIYVWFILPLVLRKRSPYQFIVFDCIATLLYIMLIAYQTGGFEWYNRLAVPITVASYAYILALAAVFRQKKMSRLMKTAFWFFATGTLTTIIDIMITYFVSGAFGASWSLIVLCVCIIFALLFLVLYRKKVLAEELIKRLFI